MQKNLCMRFKFLGMIGKSPPKKRQLTTNSSMRDNFYGSISPQSPNSENLISICFEIKCALKQIITQVGIDHCLQINYLAHQWGDVHMTQQHSKKCVEDMFHMQMFNDPITLFTSNTNLIINFPTRMHM